MSNINPIIATRKRIKCYLNKCVDNDVDSKSKKIKYTVIRLYFSHLFQTLKNYELTHQQNDSVMAFKRILHSKIINEITYEFPERIDLILSFLEDLCNSDSFTRDKIAEWDQMTVYF